jgi:hypothetical protein
MYKMALGLVASGVFLAGPALAADSYLDQLKPTTEVLKLQGRKGSSLLRPGYAVGEYTGEAKATASSSNALGIFTSNKFKTSFTVNAPSLGEGVTADCAGGQGRIRLAWITFKQDKLSYVCVYGGTAPKDAEFDLALGGGGSLLNKLAQPQRAGEFHYGKTVLRVRTELLGGLTLSNGTTSDYLITREDGTPIAALRKTSMQPTFYLPAAKGEERDAVAVLAISLFYFNDPGRQQ